MDFGMLFLFLGLAVLSGLSCKNSAIGMIERLGTASRRYPKGYITPAKWVRKLFHLSWRIIPRYLYFELFLSLFFLLLGPINLIICAAANWEPTIVGILLMFHIGLVILDAVFFVVLSFLYAPRKRKSLL